MEDDGDDKDDCKRRSRNLSEKKRRDQFNALVNELSTMVSTNNRKMDKSTVLKSTISFLKNQNEVTVRSRAHDVQEDWKPGFLSNEEFTYLLLEALEGFVMVFSTSGMIYYVSENVTSLLGHNPVDLVNNNIFDLCYEEDKQRLYNLLQNSGPGPDTMQSFAKENEIQFNCHLRRLKLTCHPTPFSVETTYELIQFNGHFRLNSDSGDDLSGFRHDNDSGSRVLFACTGRLHTPHLIRDVSLVDTNHNEFTSRHSLEWKFLFLDHRAPPIIGYLPFEVLGTSGYDYYHFDDLENIVQCHEDLMQKGELTSCYYRFLTKGQQWIWLQTRFYITYHQWNSKPEFVVCIHRVVSYSDIFKTKQEESQVEHLPKAEAPPKPLAEDVTPAVSPNYVGESSSAHCSTFVNMPKRPSSVKSAVSSTRCTVANVNSVGTTWRHQYTPGSDTTSVSGESMSTAEREYQRSSQSGNTMIPQPQHNIGAQYLQPGHFVTAVSTIGSIGAAVSGISTVGALSVEGVLPLSFPVILSSEHAQIHEQLQQKHEELQQMIVRQQEELRQVKEQLLIARLGVISPLINVTAAPLINVEEAHPGTHTLPAQILYEPGPAISGYPPYPPNQSPHPHNTPQ